jgi:hypothetical protein
MPSKNKCNQQCFEGLTNVLADTAGKKTIQIIKHSFTGQSYYVSDHVPEPQ